MVKMALEEWRHWLEGAEHPFIVWTDHKNMEYLCTANRLNSRKAQLALLFTLFNFTISYCPGSKNVKLDALSHHYSPAATLSDPETILPTSCLAAALIWGIENQAREGGLANRKFVPDAAFSPVLEWAHSSKLACHPGSLQTLAFV